MTVQVQELAQESEQVLAPASVQGSARVQAPATALEPARVPGLGAGRPLTTPSFCCGMRTMNASARFVPRLVVQMKYSPVGSRLPFGRFE